MSIKINLDDIFGHSHNEETDHQSQTHSSFHSQPDSSHHSLKINYQLRPTLFQEIPISEQQQPTKINKNQSKFGSYIANLADDQSITNNSYLSQAYSEKNIPGERLYYQSKNNMIKKKQEIALIQQQKIFNQQHNNTFKPQINKNTQRILKNSKKNTKKTQLSQLPEKIPSFVKKQQQEVKKCTFQPKLVSKLPSHTVKRNKQELFESLFHESKVKVIKQKLKTQEQTPKISQKKITKQEFDNFLSRNATFMDKAQKKNQMMIKASQHYDLSTGNKLFTPKTTAIKKKNQPGIVSEKQEIQSNQSIFSKNPHQQGKLDNLFTSFQKLQPLKNQNEDLSQFCIDEINQYDKPDQYDKFNQHDKNGQCDKIDQDNKNDQHERIDQDSNNYKDDKNDQYQKAHHHNKQKKSNEQFLDFGANGDLDQT